MKTWQSTLLGIFLGMAFGGIFAITAAAPRGTAIELAPAPTAAPVYVHISGAVQQPGVYELPIGSRIDDAILAAGGFSSDANQEAVNLAARIKDGDKIIIPKIGEPTPVIAVKAVEEVTTGLTENSAQGGPININTATMEELMTLPGIGETRAKDIIAYREANGGFKTVDELDNVKGIGPATFERLKPLITVD